MKRHELLDNRAELIQLAGLLYGQVLLDGQAMLDATSPARRAVKEAAAVLAEVEAEMARSRRPTSLKDPVCLGCDDLGRVSNMGMTSDCGACGGPGITSGPIPTTDYMALVRSLEDAAPLERDAVLVAELEDILTNDPLGVLGEDDAPPFDLDPEDQADVADAAEPDPVPASGHRLAHLLDQIDDDSTTADW